LADHAPGCVLPEPGRLRGGRAAEAQNRRAPRDFAGWDPERSRCPRQFTPICAAAPADILARFATGSSMSAILERMIDKRPEADRLLIAEIYGEARHRARWRELTVAEEAAAVAALRELAGGRGDLLAEVAGVLEGAREGELDEPLARQAAALCRKAGADPDAIPAWIEEGRRRRAAAAMPPFSGGLHGG